MLNTAYHYYKEGDRSRLPCLLAIHGEEDQKTLCDFFKMTLAIIIRSKVIYFFLFL